MCNNASIISHRAIIHLNREVVVVFTQVSEHVLAAATVASSESFSISM